MLRIDWLADPSQQGIRQSAGLMVSYEYDDRYVAANHEAYITDGFVVRSRTIDRLLEP